MREFYVWVLSVSSMCEFYLWVLCVSSMCEFYVRVLCTSSMCEFYVWLLWANYVCELCERVLCVSSLWVLCVSSQPQTSLPKKLFEEKPRGPRWEAKVRNHRQVCRKTNRCLISLRKAAGAHGGPDGTQKFATGGGADRQSKHTTPPEPLAQALCGEILKLKSTNNNNNKICVFFVSLLYNNNT